MEISDATARIHSGARSGGGWYRPPTRPSLRTGQQRCRASRCRGERHPSPPCRARGRAARGLVPRLSGELVFEAPPAHGAVGDRKSTRLNSSHANISYAVFCLKKKKKI